MKFVTRMNKARPIMMAMVFAIGVMGTSLVQVNQAHAAGGTATWTGATGDNKFSTAGNWAEAAIPEDGDILVLGEPTNGFTGVAGTDPLYVTVDNDLAVTFDGVTSVATTVGAFYSFDNSLLLAANATITLPSSNNVSFYFTDTAATGVVGAGNLTISGSAFEFYGPSAINGTLTLKDGATAYANVVGMTQLILDGGSLRDAVTGTHAFPIYIVSPSAMYATQNGGLTEDPETMTYTGAVTLDADLTVYTSTLKVVHFTGAISGTGKIVAAANQTGTLTVDAYAVAPEEDETVGAPNTGVANFASANPLAILATGIAAAGAVFIATRKRA